MVWINVSEDAMRRIDRTGSEEIDVGKVDWAPLQALVGRLKEKVATWFSSDVERDTDFDPILLMPELSCTGSFTGLDLLALYRRDAEQRD